MPTNEPSNLSAGETSSGAFSATHPAISVSVEDARLDPDSDPDLGQPLSALAGAVERVLVGEGVVSGTVSLILVDLSDMAELNEEHMGVVGPTDVLSFPLDPPATELDPPATELDPPATELDPPGVEPDLRELAAHIGDILICVEVAAAQAPQHCGSVEAELQLLTIHGTLHLLGHDHAEPDERRVMQSHERNYLSAVGFDHPGDQR